MASKWLQDRLKSLKARWVGPRPRTALDDIHDWIDERAGADRLLELKHYAAAIAEHRRIADVRAGMCDRFTTLPPNATQAAYTQQWKEMCAYAVAHGDSEAAEVLGRAIEGRDPLANYRARQGRAD